MITRALAAVLLAAASLAAAGAAAACRSTGRAAGPARLASRRVGPAARDPLAAASLMGDVRWLCAPERAGRGSFQPGGIAAAAYMAAALEETGLAIVRQPIAAGGVDNVIGIKRADAEAVLVSAHYDHLGIDAAGRVYPGADDNASGAAVLLGLARAASARCYRHTILFASFGAEEAGLVGSGVYVTQPTWPLERTRMVINFDMVGRNFFEWGSGRAGAAAVVGLETRPSAEGPARRAARAAGLDLIAVPAHLVELFGFEDRTDDWWFRRRGVPAIHISTSLHDDYHQPTDTPDRLSPSQLERVARMSAGLLSALAEPIPCR